MKYKYYLVGILLSLGILGCQQQYGFDPEDITNMYASYVSEWQVKAKASFDKAEGEVLSKPQPKPDNIVGPDPDINKCICRGTGIIVHGDDHKTPCPFHHKGDNPQTKPPVPASTIRR